MLYTTLSQPVIFACMLAGGIAGGLLFVLAHSLLTALKAKRICFDVANFFCTICCAAIFYFISLSTNYGQFRLFAIATFVFSIIATFFVLNKIFVKVAKICYNKLYARRKKKKNN